MLPKYLSKNLCYSAIHTFAVTVFFTLLHQSLYANTLTQVLNDALINDHQFKAATAQLNAGKENKNIGKANILPSINGNASWSKSDSDVEGTTLSQTMPGVRDAIDFSQDQTIKSYGIELNQPIINIAAWNTYKLQKSVASIAEINFNDEQQNIILRTSQAYFNVLKAQDDLTTANAEKEALKQQLEQTKQRFQVGLTAITGVHEAQAAFDSSVANTLIAQGQVGITNAALEVITGKRYASLAPLKKDFPVLAATPANANEWVKIASQNNYSIISAKENMKRAEIFSKSKKAGHYPTLTGSLSYSNQNLDTSPIADSFDRETSISRSIALRLNIPIYNGGGVSSSRKQAAYQSLQARENYLLAKSQIVQQTKSAHLNVTTSVATVKARKQAITSNESALNATQAGYEVGTRDLVDVLNAQRNLYSAQRDYYDSLYSYILNSLNLQSLAGALDKVDIEKLSEWLQG